MDGVNPELSNLTCSMTYVEPGDIVFLTSDGISDNFDPVVGKFCVPKRNSDTSAAGRLGKFFVPRKAGTRNSLNWILALKSISACQQKMCASLLSGNEILNVM